ncbi:MAG: hypothetical protein J6D02_05920 [Lachnospira sp.]|nr:hypothetical protein [Lachnospira sp.]
MKKLFKAIRQENLEEVASIIEKNPELVNCVATPPPKKDNGQSPLQVATKIGAIEIINYLLEHGADVNFMEAEDDDPGVRAPVLHDAIRMTLISLCYKQLDKSDYGIKLVEELLKRGADPNKRASNGFDALNTAISDAEYVLEKDIYSDTWTKAEQQITKLFDVLIEYGADFNAWANHGHFPEPHPMESNKERYLDDFVTREDVVQAYTIRGQQHETIIKGDIDKTAHTRAIMQAYCKERGLL